MRRRRAERSRPLGLDADQGGRDPGGSRAKRGPSGRHLARLKRVVESVLRGCGARVYLYGSYARGDARRGSDVDIAVRGEPLGADRVSRLREAIEESEVPYRVDVLDWTEAGPALRRSVLREGILWRM